MAERLYLIRVDMERFIGPLTLRELRESYRRMEFGLQDEIASSNKPWIAFDDLDRISRIYPELAQMIKKEMLSGWGSTESEPRSLPSAERIDSLPRKTFSLFLKLSSLIFITALVFVIVYAVREKRVNDLKAALKDPKIIQAAYLYGGGHNPSFESFMHRNRKKINRSIRKNRSFSTWIPFIRTVAFTNEGKWEGISAKKIRGKDAAQAPVDCSVSMWKDRWISSEGQWERFLRGRILPNEDWAKLLVWDPAWISQRLNHRYWLEPRNYYEACLQMSKAGLEEAFATIKSPSKTVILSRLNWMIGQIDNSLGTSDETEFQMSGSLWSLSCIEDSDEDSALQNCQNSVRLGKDWKKFSAERVQLRKVRRILENHTSIKGSLLEDMKANISTIPNKAFLTGLDYRQELKFYQLLIGNSGNLDAANNAMKARNSSLNFLR